MSPKHSVSLATIAKQAHIEKLCHVRKEARLLQAMPNLQQYKRHNPKLSLALNVLNNRWKQVWAHIHEPSGFPIQNGSRRLVMRRITLVHRRAKELPAAILAIMASLTSANLQGIPLLGREE
eukprot:11129745-Heterocapsa_arctica.AAC.1